MRIHTLNLVPGDGELGRELEDEGAHGEALGKLEGSRETRCNRLATAAEGATHARTSFK